MVLEIREAVCASKRRLSEIFLGEFYSLTHMTKLLGTKVKYM